MRIDLASGFALSRQELSSLMVAPAVGMSTLNYPFVILNLFLGMTGYKISRKTLHLPNLNVCSYHLARI